MWLRVESDRAGATRRTRPFSFPVQWGSGMVPGQLRDMIAPIPPFEAGRLPGLARNEHVVHNAARESRADLALLNELVKLAPVAFS